MHTLHAEIAMQITESRIADAERARLVRASQRHRRVRARRARRVLRTVTHPRPALARLVHPE